MFYLVWINMRSSWKAFDLLLWLSVVMLLWLLIICTLCCLFAAQCNCYSRNFFTVQTHQHFYTSQFIWLFATLKTLLIIFLELSLVPPQAERGNTMSPACVYFSQWLLVWSALLRWGVTFTCASGRNANRVIWFGLNEEEPEAVFLVVLSPRGDVGFLEGCWASETSRRHSRAIWDIIPDRSCCLDNGSLYFQHLVL